MPDRRWVKPSLIGLDPSSATSLEELWALIEKLREQNHVGFREIAKSAKISQATVSNMFNGKSRITADRMSGFLAALGIDTEDELRPWLMACSRLTLEHAYVEMPKLDVARQEISSKVNEVAARKTLLDEKIAILQSELQDEKREKERLEKAVVAMATSARYERQRADSLQSQIEDRERCIAELEDQLLAAKQERRFIEATSTVNQKISETLTEQQELINALSESAQYERNMRAQSEKARQELEARYTELEKLLVRYRTQPQGKSNSTRPVVVPVSNEEVRVTAYVTGADFEQERTISVPIKYSWYCNSCEFGGSVRQDYCHTCGNRTEPDCEKPFFVRLYKSDRTASMKGSPDGYNDNPNETRGKVHVTLDRRTPRN